MPKKSEDYFKKHAKGITMEDLDSKLDLILEHVAGTDKNVADLKEDMTEVKGRLEKIEVTLVGKADNSRVDRLDGRVTRIEQVP